MSSNQIDLHAQRATQKATPWNQAQTKQALEKCSMKKGSRMEADFYTRSQFKRCIRNSFIS